MSVRPTSPTLFPYTTLFRSEGQRGRVICLEQVEDTRHALEFLQTREEVQKDRIAVYGQSFGAAVAVYAAGVEPRIAAERKSTRLNSSHRCMSYAVFCLNNKY